MKIRLTCPPTDTPRALEQLRAAFDVDEVSHPYTNHGPSRLERVYLDVRLRTPEITPTVANHVLHHFGAGGYVAGSFVQDLIMLIARADPENRARLALGHPGYVAAVTLAQATPDGITALLAIASSTPAASSGAAR